MSWMSWQIDYLLLLQNFREFSHGIFDNFFLGVSELGLTGITFFILFSVYWCYNKKIGMYMVYCFATAYMMNIFLKMSFCIYRPWLLDAKVHPVEQAVPGATGYSFPSGHTSGGTSTWGSFAVSFWKNKWIRYSSLAVIFLVMLSRNYLGVHTPQDVVVSFLVTFGLVLVVKKIFDIAETKKYGYGVFISIITILLILLGLYVTFKTYPMDYVNGNILYDPSSQKLSNVARLFNLFGLMFGCYLEMKVLKFDPKVGGIIRKIARLAIGIFILTLIEGQFKGFLEGCMDHQIAKCLDRFIAGFFLTFLYPCFIKFNEFIISKLKNKTQVYVNNEGE